MRKPEKVIEKVHGRVVVGSGTAEEFFARSLERARKLDRGEPIPAEIRVTFEDPVELARVLSVERVRMLRAIRAKATPVAELAAKLKRDRKAVRRDVDLLESLGLVRTREEPNPGHGRRRVVEPRAGRYQLVVRI